MFRGIRPACLAAVLVAVTTTLTACGILWAPPARWARTAESGSTYSFSYSAVAVDDSGNVHVAGHQRGPSAVSYGDGVSIAGVGGSADANAVLVSYDPSGKAIRARTVTAISEADGLVGSFFFAVAADAAGNLYAAGCQDGTRSYDYGDGLWATGTSSYANALLVKYDPSGVPLWVRSVSSGSDDSIFRALAVDAAGNVYAAGGQTGAGAYRYGDGVELVNPAIGGYPVLVKYDSNGTALWARTASATPAGAGFSAVAVDQAGNVYAAGGQSGTQGYDYGSGFGLSAPVDGANAVLVKYNASGTLLWARCPDSGTSTSSFSSIALSPSGEVVAAGAQAGTGSNDYGGGAVVTGPSPERNILLVKYGPSGTVLWARSESEGTGSSGLFSVAVDASGDIFAAGCFSGRKTYGSGISVSGLDDLSNSLLVKFDSSGTARWAQTVSEGPSISDFQAVAVDDSGNIYAAGRQCDVDQYSYGWGVSVSGLSWVENGVLVKY